MSHFTSLPPRSDRSVPETHVLHTPTGEAPITRWTVLRDLSRVRADFGLSDRAITVLSALLSFCPRNRLEDPEASPAHAIVFPSNRTLCERAGSMSESTLRRHLSALVKVGIIARRDSPNRKRYARRSALGQQHFGFDLTPFWSLRFELHDRAAAAEAETQAIKLTRERISLLLLDLAPSMPNEETVALRRILRRKLSLGDLTKLHARLVALVGEDHTAPCPVAEIVPDAVATPEMIASDSHSGRHIQGSDKNTFDSERDEIPLCEIEAHCTELMSFDPRPLRSWPDLIDRVARIVPMMGIDISVWQQACQRMSAKTATLTVAAILQKLSTIRSPGAYLRRLIQKAEKGQFSPRPMFRSLAQSPS